MREQGYYVLMLMKLNAINSPYYQTLHIVSNNHNHYCPLSHFSKALTSTTLQNKCTFAQGQSISVVRRSAYFYKNRKNINDLYLLITHSYEAPLQEVQFRWESLGYFGWGIGKYQLNIVDLQLYVIININQVVQFQMKSQKRTISEAIRSEMPSKTLKLIDSRYEVKDIYLGEGAFGEVFVCWDKLNYQILAVKIISKTKLIDKISRSESKEKAAQFYIQSLREEALVMQKMSHPNIVRFYGYSESNSQLYYFLEYCNEGTLEALIKKEGKLPINIAVPLMRQILSAVIYLQQNFICHLDIKPQNILLHNGSAKLADFGFAVSLRKGESKESYCVGTEAFIAPELIEHKRISLKSDVWSLGVTFFRMICGHNPWPYSQDEKVWINKLKTLPTITCNSAPLWLKLVINKMLTFNEDFRPSASDLKHFFSF